MIAGDPERFAIEAEVEERIDNFVLGHFRFWMCGRPVGDWRDSADLLGCLHWLKDFHDEPPNRYEPGLWDLPPGEVFRLLYDPVMAGSNAVPVHEAPVPNAYSRFHIAYLGMSSLDWFHVLLLTD